jgi:hypothetical protein
VAAGAGIGVAVLAATIAVVLALKRCKRHNKDDDQLTDFFEVPATSTYTMALEEDADNRTVEFESRPPNGVLGKPEPDDDPMFVSEYGISDDGIGFMPGRDEFELGNPAPGRSSILHRPLLRNF